MLVVVLLLGDCRVCGDIRFVCLLCVVVCWLLLMAVDYLASVVDCWLVVGCVLLLIVSCWLLVLVVAWRWMVVGFWMLVGGGLLLVVGCSRLVVRCCVLVVVFIVGEWLVVVGCVLC